MQPGFMMYTFTVLVFALVMIYVVVPRHGRTNPLVYISICSTVGSLSIMAVKGLGVAVKLTFSGSNQFTHPSTYVFGIVVAVCILVQMNYFNKALDTFSTNVVNPMYYVGFSSCTILASLILFQGFYNSSNSNTLSLLCGFVITFLGVHLLNLSRAAEPPLPPSHSALEAGVMNPRLSLQGRMSMDGWGAPAGVGTPVQLHGFGHAQRSSRGSRSSILFSAYEDELPAANGNLDRLPEEDEDADERTHLRSAEPRDGRQHRASPRGTPTQVSRSNSFRGD